MNYFSSNQEKICCFYLIFFIKENIEKLIISIFTIAKYTISSYFAIQVQLGIFNYEFPKSNDNLYLR